jgi:hypothetical protein
VTIDVARIAFAQQEYRITPAIEDLSIQTRHPLAVEAEIQTILQNSTDANSFGATVLALRKLDRWTWACFVAKRNYSPFEIGATITLKYPRFGFANGRNFIIKRVRTDSSALFDELTLFGPESTLEDEMSSFSIAAPSSLSEGDSGTTAFVFTVTRTGGLGYAAAVDWTVSGSGANPASATDFVGGAFPSGTASFAVGQSSANISVPVQGDTSVEPDENFTVTLSNPRTIGSLVVPSGSTTILNDDSGSGPTATFSMTQLPDSNRIYQRSTLSGGGQGKGQGTISVTISSAVAGTVSARCRASDGTTILQAEWTGATITTGATTANITGVDARLGWFYLDLKGADGAWKNGTTLVGMGALFAVAGQSLMSRFIGRADSSGTYASAGLTPSANSRVLASWNDGFSYQPTVSTMPWQLPGDLTDGTGPTSVGVGYFLNDAVSELGVNSGIIGHAHGGVYFGAYMTGRDDWTQFAAVIARAGGAFEGFFWGQGHSDSSVCCTPQAYQDMLTLLHAQLAAINSFTSFKTYVWTIPAIGSNTLGSNWQYNNVRLGAKNWCTANGEIYVHAYDFTTDGLHEQNTTGGAGWLGRTMFRATRATYGLSSGLGPVPLSATRSGTTITVTVSDVGQTNLVLTGSPQNRICVFPTGKVNNKDSGINDNRFPVSAVSVTNKTTLSLTLANDPGVGNVLDLWFYFGITSGDSSADNINDNRVDDGLPKGRVLQANFTPITVAAPTPGGATNSPPVVVASPSSLTMTETSTTYGASASGFGSQLTAGRGSCGSASFNPAFTIEGFFVCPTWATLVMFNGLANGDFVALNTSGNVWTGGGATGATACIVGHRYHVAYVFGPTGRRLYLTDITAAGSGIRDANSTTPLSPLEWSQGAPAFQLAHLNGGFLFSGGLDEWAFWYGERYTGSTYTAPSSPYLGTETNLVALYHLDGNATESVQH